MEEKKDGHSRGRTFAIPVDARKNNVDGLNGLFWVSRDPDTNERVFHVELRNAIDPMRQNFDECIKFVSAVLWWVADYEGVFFWSDDGPGDAPLGDVSEDDLV